MTDFDQRQQWVQRQYNADQMQQIQHQYNAQHIQQAQNEYGAGSWPQTQNQYNAENIQQIQHQYNARQVVFNSYTSSLGNRAGVLQETTKPSLPMAIIVGIISGIWTALLLLVVEVTIISALPFWRNGSKDPSTILVIYICVFSIMGIGGGVAGVLMARRHIRLTRSSGLRYTNQSMKSGCRLGVTFTLIGSFGSAIVVAIINAHKGMSIAVNVSNAIIAAIFVFGALIALGRIASAFSDRS